MRIRKFGAIALIFVLLLGLAACDKGADKAAVTPTESATASSQRTVITMTIPCNGVPGFEAAFEEKYPAYDLEVEFLATGVINGEVARRLRNGHGADIVTTNLPMGEVRNYAYDISTADFSENYQARTLKSLTIEGKLYYLPMPGSLYGYIINKTLLDEMGLAVPTTTEELLNCLAVSKEQGIGVSADGYNFGLGTIGSTYIGSYIVSAFAPDFLSTAEGAKWVSGLDSAESAFTGTWEKSVDFLSKCVESGFFNPKRLIISYNQSLSSTANAFKPEVELPARTALCAYDSVAMLRSITSLSEDEFVMLPLLPSSEDGNAMVSAVSNHFIFINKAIEGDENKLAGALAVLDFLSTEEGQALWMSDTACPYSYLTGVDPDYELIPASLKEYFDKGQVYVNPFPTDLLSVIGSKLVPVVASGADISEALADIDDYVKNGSDDEVYDQSVVGTVAEDMLCENGNVRKEETSLGNLISDAIREETGADVALVNGGGIRSSLYKGDVTGSDLSSVCPYGNLIIVAEMDGATLRAAITNGIQKTWKPAGQFLQVSGIRYSYTPAHDETETAVLVSLTHDDGTPVEDDEVFTVAYTNYMGGSSGYVDSGDGYTMLNVYDETLPVTVSLVKETGKTYRDTLVSYFAAHADQAISVSPEGRITIVAGE